MAVANRPDDSGVSKPLSDLLTFLKSKLGGLYFDNAGTPARDKAYLNLIRLRALFENTPGDYQKDRLLKHQFGTTVTTINDYVEATRDVRLGNTSAILFGQPGQPWRANVSGNIGSGDAAGPARAAVDAQWKQMQKLGGAEAVRNPPASTNEGPVGVLAPERADVDAIRAGNQRGIGGVAGGEVTTAADGTVSSVSGGDGHEGHDHGGGVLDSGLPAAGAARQIPGGGELWLVDGTTYYLAYTIPDTSTPLLWKVESNDRLQAIYGTAVPEVNKRLTSAELKRLSPWQMGGLTAELANTDEDPWQQFVSDFEKAAALRPWLKDPSTLAVISVAYLEGRAPTSDELATTDWWNNHTADERAWMEETATLGREEVERRRDDASRGVMEALRKAGMANPSKALADYIAEQRLTGRWSETHTSEQIRKITDPFAPGQLDRGLRLALRDPAVSDPTDMRALSQGREAVMDRVRAIFTNARVPIEAVGERAEERLDRIASEIMSGKRSFTDVRRSVDLLATKTPGGRPGGFDVNTQHEDRVRNLVREWVGPSVAAGFSDQWIAEQAGKIRNNPDAEQELITHLQNTRLSAFSGWTDRSLRYEDIAPLARSLVSRVWGQSLDESDPLFLDVVNMQDQTAAAQKLRAEGRKRGVEKVNQDLFADLRSTPMGDQVVRSSV